MNSTSRSHSTTHDLHTHHWCQAPFDGSGAEIQRTRVVSVRITTSPDQPGTWHQRGVVVPGTPTRMATVCGRVTSLGRVFPLKDENPTMRLPIVTILLIVVNVAVYFFVQPLELNAGTDFTFETAAIPDEITSGEPLSEQEYCSIVQPTSSAFNAIVDTGTICAAPGTDARFPDKNVYLAALSSMFLHGGLMHLGGNMLFLWVFGNNIEDHLGRFKYLLFYLLAGVVATIAHIAGDPGSIIPVVGASGAVAGVMGAYLVWFPWARIKTIALVMLLDLKAWMVLAFWFVSQFFISPSDGVAWLAHVGGFVFGVIIAALARSSDGFRTQLWEHKYLTQNPGAGRGAWDPRYGGREVLQDGRTPTWHPGP